MKFKPYFVRLGDCFILGPSVSLEFGAARVGLCFVSFEVGVAFTIKEIRSYACGGCGTIAYGIDDEIPPEWKKVERPDNTFFYLCPKCKGNPKYEAQEDYVITPENRERALDELITDLAGTDLKSAHALILRKYCNRLLDEGVNWRKSDLGDSLSSYTDGRIDAYKEVAPEFKLLLEEAGSTSTPQQKVLYGIICEFLKMDE